MSEHGTRPVTVRIAVVLLAIVGIGYLVDAIALVAGAGQYVDQVHASVDASPVGPAGFGVVEPFATTAPYLSATLVAVAGLVLLVLAGSVRAGHFVGRILVWIASGLALACSVCALGTAQTPGFSGIAYISAARRDENGVYQFSQRLPDGYPAAYRYLSGGFAFLAMLALIAVIVLLAQRSANRFFRPEPSVPPPVGYWPAPPPGFHPAPAPASAPAPTPASDVHSRLSIVERRYQRGELTAEEYERERRRVLGG